MKNYKMLGDNIKFVMKKQKNTTNTSLVMIEIIEFC